MKRILAVMLSAVFLSGCASGDISRREYIRSVYIGNGISALEFYGESEKFISDVPLERLCESAEAETGREIFTGHTELIVLGNLENAESVLEFMLSEWKVPMSCIAAYSGEIPEISGEKAVERLRILRQQGKIPESGVSEVLGRILSDEPLNLPEIQ